MEQAKPIPVPDSTPITVRSGELTIDEQQRVKAMQRLANAPDRPTYLALQQEIAQQLNMTVRNVQLLMKAWQTEGVAGVVRQGRSDRGERRLDEDWTNYILQTYRAGNRGGRRMSRAQVAVRVAARALEIGDNNPPSRASVYRVLQSEMDRQEERSRSRSIGWSGETLILRTREGLEVVVRESNQVWQCDHTRVDLLVVDQVGEVLGRPWLTTIVDTHSRCIIGIHLGMEAPSAVVVCLALRHAILPKQYSSAYELTQLWGTYGIPQYLYTDGGKEFNSKHLEQVANELKIVLCQRRYPAEGGIVERPFGTLNTELFANLPGYTGSSTKRRPKQAETNASLTLMQLEKQIVRYLVDRYNQGIDPRIGDQTRLGRWESDRLAQLPLLSDRELDICLMRRDRRTVYRGGYIQFANLNYRGEHLEGYTGSWVVLRYNPRDITSILIYREDGGKDIFLSRAHATGLETEILSYAEAQAMSRRLRQAGKTISNQSMFEEVRSRDRDIEEQQRRKTKRSVQSATPKATRKVIEPASPDSASTAAIESEDEAPVEIVVPDVRVYDYEALKQEFDLW
ncbi:Mu transposase C-terminal domain-containing protein [Leptolyngbya sp. NIES-2104]|uniref:Mu transposase C-terminal domain-containing protein n=1 Tax=Leptolyngbya sp. NIES-2104 TaxID=1552121 RepID=UPI0006ECC983|nr:Mu transposase C-terminal domain-containing protein [Leptolyngbya sp. NIES-2104]GAQ00085.1 Tn552 transposase [Leptolyngbya sp. NIES-2104]